MQNVLENIVKGIQHIGIPSGDLEAAAMFYTSLGFREIFRTVIGDENQHVRFFALNGIVIEAYEAKDSEMKSGTIDHIALDVSDIEEVYKELIRLGHKAIEGGICFLPFFENGVRYFTLEGSDKEKIEFNQKL